MNYLLKSKPKNENRTRIILIVSVYIFLSVCGIIFGNMWRTLVVTATKPLWSIGNFIVSPLNGVGKYFSSQTSLVSQNILLEDQIANLKTKETDYDALQKENEDLKNQLGRTGNSSRILSAVLSKPPRSPYDTFVLDLGSADGVFVSSNVFLGDSTILGTVSSVTSHTALVTLFSSSGHTVDTTVARTGATYTLRGTGGGNFQVDVPKDTDIVWGDVFVYPGLSQSIVASVYYIDTNSQSSFKTIYARLTTNVFATQYVFVEKVQ